MVAEINFCWLCCFCWFWEKDLENGFLYGEKGMNLNYKKNTQSPLAEWYKLDFSLFLYIIFVGIFRKILLFNKPIMPSRCSASDWLSKMLSSTFLYNGLIKKWDFTKLTKIWTHGNRLKSSFYHSARRFGIFSL